MREGNKRWDSNFIPRANRCTTKGGLNMSGPTESAAALPRGRGETSPPLPTTPGEWSSNLYIMLWIQHRQASLPAYFSAKSRLFCPSFLKKSYKSSYAVLSSLKERQAVNKIIGRHALKLDISGCYTYYFEGPGLHFVLTEELCADQSFPPQFSSSLKPKEIGQIKYDRPCELQYWVIRDWTQLFLVLVLQYLWKSVKSFSSTYLLRGAVGKVWRFGPHRVMATEIWGGGEWEMHAIDQNH